MPVTAREKILTAAKLAKYKWEQFLVMACGSSMGSTADQKRRLASYYKLDKYSLEAILSEVRQAAQVWKNVHRRME